MAECSYYRQKSRQCMRLHDVITDARAREGLKALADEFTVKAEAEEATARTVVLMGNGEEGTLITGSSPIIPKNSAGT